MSSIASILVVDDQTDHLNAVEMLLVGFGYRVVLCTSGSQALHQLETEPIDLILADVAMPQMNGYQLLEAVRRQAQWATVPFIFITGRALDSDIRYGKALGADDYLTKPIQPEDLLAVVEGKLRRHAQLAQATRQPGTTPLRQAVQAGRVRLDVRHHRAWLDEQPLTLSVKEFTLLEQLTAHVGVIVSACTLVHATHGLTTSDTDEARELIRPLVRSLRQKLGDNGAGPALIETVRGLGYRLVDG